MGKPTTKPLKHDIINNCMSIHILEEKIKGYIKANKKDLFYYLILVISCSFSFYLGFEARAGQKTASLVAINCPIEAYLPQNGIDNSKEAIGAPVSINPSNGQYIASKNGNNYYPLGCKSASRIKPENVVSFNTEEEAINAGFVRTELCK